LLVVVSLPDSRRRMTRRGIDEEEKGG